ncbi:Variable outer membrane protein (plasmid) [Borrelia nietonii YOR]|uniref:Variable outer membrane protein n=2 Tax=Borrelia TaxID=138 RepID=W5SBV6_9SPIR|nr:MULTISPECIES: hypothetical protein [Borrelia]AHH04380.1 Variable outer membrane protein [Borrelia nietonii YOR]AHH14787.1 Variable outer membrane protein [Borrelia hermsii MTW]UPA10075.1 hypothetical protein bhYOR_001448 [Borrelia nietonii YOR]
MPLNTAINELLKADNKVVKAAIKELTAPAKPKIPAKFLIGINKFK